jgi:peptidoglycan hydrolase-like protein with peptidoglycan-binding domain
VDALLEAHGDWLPPLAAGALAGHALIHLRSARRSADGRDRECAGFGEDATGGRPGPTGPSHRDICNATQGVVVTDPIQPWPMSRNGDQGHPVLTLQELLRAHGHAIAVDGVFGPVTEAAVRAVQTAAHVTVDGIVGPQTWPRVVVTVRRGSTGDAVRGVQVEFQFRNLSGDPAQGLQVDGVFGPKTEAAVRGFQDALDITVDGIVGPVTWRALVSGMLSF